MKAICISITAVICVSIILVVLLNMHYERSVAGYQAINGMQLSYKSRTTWHIPEQNDGFYPGEIVDIEYNQAKK